MMNAQWLFVSSDAGALKPTDKLSPAFLARVWQSIDGHLLYRPGHMGFDAADQFIKIDGRQARIHTGQPDGILQPVNQPIFGGKAKDEPAFHQRIGPGIRGADRDLDSVINRRLDAVEPPLR